MKYNPWLVMAVAVPPTVGIVVFVVVCLWIRWVCRC